MSYSVWTLRSPWGCHQEAAAILPLRQCCGCSWWRQQKNNHIWRVLRGWFPGNPLDVCGTEFWVVGSDRRVYGSLGWVPGRLVTTVLCVSKQSTWKLPFAKLSKWKLTIKELGNVGQLREAAVTTEKREEEVEEEEWGEKTWRNRKGRRSRGRRGKRRQMIQVRFPKLFQTALHVPFPEGSAAIPDVKTWRGKRRGKSQLSGGWWRKGNLMGKAQYKAWAYGKLPHLGEETNKQNKKLWDMSWGSCSKCNGLYFREEFSCPKCAGCSTSWCRRQLGTKQKEASCYLERVTGLGVFKKKWGKGIYRNG